MHVLPSLFIFSCLGSVLASPLSLNPLTKKSATAEVEAIEEAKQQASTNNTSCPADLVQEMENMVFDYSMSTPKFPTTTL
jgi:hypothetical protein